MDSTDRKFLAQEEWRRQEAPEARREEKATMKSMVDIMKQSTVANKSFQDTMSMFMQAMIAQQCLNC